MTGSADKKEFARKKLAEVMTEHQCQLVAIGNGTACRETEEIITEMIEQDLPQARYLIVNEAGASIYSASPVARERIFRIWMLRFAVRFPLAAACRIR